MKHDPNPETSEFTFYKTVTIGKIRLDSFEWFEAELQYCNLAYSIIQIPVMQMSQRHMKVEMIQESEYRICSSIS